MARLGMSWSWVSGVRVTGSKCPTRWRRRTHSRRVCENWAKTILNEHKCSLFLCTRVGRRFYLQVLFNVFSVICNTTGSDTRLPHQLKADLSTQVVWNFTLLPNTQQIQSMYVYYIRKVNGTVFVNFKCCCLLVREGFTVCSLQLKVEWH